MTPQQAIELLKKRGFVAHIMSDGTIAGGVKVVVQAGIQGYDEAFLIRPFHRGDDGDGDEGFTVTIVYGRQDIPVSDLKTCVDVIYTSYMQRGLVPPVPTSGTWEGDAQALIDMGADTIDANTVKGLLKELRQHRLALARIEGRMEGRLRMNEVAAEVHPDRLARTEARLRADAYTNALADVKIVVKQLQENDL